MTWPRISAVRAGNSHVPETWLGDRAFFGIISVVFAPASSGSVVSGVKESPSQVGYSVLPRNF